MMHCQLKSSSNCWIGPRIQDLITSTEVNISSECGNNEYQVIRLIRSSIKNSPLVSFDKNAFLQTCKTETSDLCQRQFCSDHERGLSFRLFGRIHVYCMYA